MIFETRTTTSRRGVGWRGAVPLLVAATIGLGGCANILDVENPNNLIEQELDNPASARSIVNGASATVARGIGAMLGIFSTVSDEFTWIGSRDAWRELDQGFLDNPRNEFTDDAFRFMSEGRWMADEAVRRLEAFDAAGTLINRNELARAYLFSAVAYITIGDMFEDYVLSDRRNPGPSIGPTNMLVMYDSAIVRLTKGLAITEATPTIRAQLLGTRARAHHAREVRSKLMASAGQTPANPLVNNAAANADAAAALALDPDFRFVLTLETRELAIAGEASLAYNVIQRGELGVHPVYGRITTAAATTNLPDPITDEPDPILSATLTELRAAHVHQPITITSAREMRLILAEAALAEGNTTEFRRLINEIRAAAGLPAFTGQSGITDRQMLIHTRRVVFFAQGRRLVDMYRFGITSPVWQTTAAAVARPGTFLPITCIEVRSHPQDFPGVEC